MIFKTMIFALFTLLIVKIYFCIELEQARKSRHLFFTQLLINGYAGFLPFPILRRPDNSVEKILIKKINVTVGLFWGLCFAIMLLLVVSDRVLLY